MGCSATRQSAVSAKDVPAELQQYVANAEARLAKEQAVIPCEHCGDLHGNWTGAERGFCCMAHVRTWKSFHGQTLRAVEGDILEHWEKLDPDFIVQSAGLSDTPVPPYRKMRGRIVQAVDDQALQYQGALGKMSDQERAKLASFEELWPCGTHEELKELSVQPEEATTVRLTYAAGVRCLEALYLFSLSIARFVGADAGTLRWNVKRPVRIWRKTIDSYPSEYGRNDFRHCSDVYRTSFCVQSIGQVEVLLEVLEHLGRDAYDREAAMCRLGLSAVDAHYVVERIKNRFAQAALGGYTDVLVNLRINGYVTEIQVHLQHLLDLRGDMGRTACKWRERYIRLEDEYWGDSTEDGLPHGRGTLFPVGGGRYDGDFFNGQRHGSGIFYFDSGDRYEGRFVDGKRHGFGTFFYASGDRYKGGFQADKMHGYGTFFGANGDRYEGGYVEGKKHGPGMYYFADGRKQEGEWWQNRHVEVVSL